MEIKQGTVCFVVGEKKVLLALIEYADARRWNGIGGVVEENETPEQAVVREVNEETELKIDKEDLMSHGSINFAGLQLHVFTISKWSGVIKSKEPSLKELRWFDFDGIPYSKMWAGNKQWLPKVLNGESI